jgi:hypothetical protein
MRQGSDTPRPAIRAFENTRQRTVEAIARIRHDQHSRSRGVCQRRVKSHPLSATEDSVPSGSTIGGA